MCVCSCWVPAVRREIHLHLTCVPVRFLPDVPTFLFCLEIKQSQHQPELLWDMQRGWICNWWFQICWGLHQWKSACLLPFFCVVCHRLGSWIFLLTAHGLICYSALGALTSFFVKSLCHVCVNLIPGSNTVVWEFAHFLKRDGFKKTTSEQLFYLKLK